VVKLPSAVIAIFPESVKGSGGSPPDALPPEAALSPDALSPDALSPDALSPDALSSDDALCPEAALSPDSLSPDALSPDSLSPDDALCPEDTAALCILPLAASQRLMDSQPTPKHRRHNIPAYSMTENRAEAMAEFVYMGISSESEL
jgi:hypothetical protein